MCADRRRTRAPPPPPPHTQRLSQFARAPPPPLPPLPPLLLLPPPSCSPPRFYFYCFLFFVARRASQLNARAPVCCRPRPIEVGDDKCASRRREARGARRKHLFFRLLLANLLIGAALSVASQSPPQPPSPQRGGILARVTQNKQALRFLRVSSPANDKIIFGMRCGRIQTR